MRIILAMILAVICGCASVNKGKSLMMITDDVLGFRIGVDTQKIPTITLAHARQELQIVPVSENKKIYAAPAIAKFGAKSVWSNNFGISALMASGQAAIENKEMYFEDVGGIGVPTPTPTPAITPKLEE